MQQGRHQSRHARCVVRRGDRLGIYLGRLHEPTVLSAPPTGDHHGPTSLVPGAPGLGSTDVKVSTRGDYASRALLSLALHGDGQTPRSVREIADKTGLPQPYLEQILLALKGAGLVRSKRGVGGGYVLARRPSLILLSQIVAAVDGPIVAGDFSDPHTDGACDHEGQCVLLSIWASAGSHMRSYLDSFTLETIATMARGEVSWPDA